jgi:5-methylcytosine-specific restriction endonuclease McrA
MTIAHTLKNEDFYNSKEWRETRYKFLAGVADKKCCVCMARDNIEIHVDHIKPRWLYPELAFDHRNLRILCAPCNLGKYTDVPLSNKPLKKVILRKQNELLDLKTGDK